MRSGVTGQRGASIMPIVAPPMNVVGNQLRDATGRRAVLQIIDVQMIPYYVSVTNTQDTYAAAVRAQNYAQVAASMARHRALGANCIRCQIWEPSVYAAAIYMSKAAAIAQCQGILNAAKAQGMMVIFSPDADGSNASPGTAFNFANWTDYEPLLADLYASTGNDPYLILEIFNEGADYTSYPNGPLWRAAVEGLLSYWRGLGNTQPVIVPWNNFGQGIQTSGYNNGFNAAQPIIDMTAVMSYATTNSVVGQGVMFSYHQYNDQWVSGANGNTIYGDWFNPGAQAEIYSKLGTTVATYPIIVTESGRLNGFTTTICTMAETAYAVSLTRQGLNGYTLFGYDRVLNVAAFDNSSMSYDGLNLNQWGLNFISSSTPFYNSLDGSPAIPNNTAVPVITGSTTTGSTLTVSNGTWTGSPTFTYQWLQQGFVISGATATTHVIVSGDAGMTLQCIVTATNVAGSTGMITDLTVCTSTPTTPTNSVAPVIGGNSYTGSILTVTNNGTWVGAAEITYQWQANGSNISGQTQTTYQLVSGNIGQSITCLLTATNSAASATHASNTITGTSASSPSSSVAPAISGNTTTGSLLSVTNGTWTGAPELAYAYQWKANGTNIGGATHPYYTLSGNTGQTITCSVTAENMDSLSASTTSNSVVGT